MSSSAYTTSPIIKENQLHLPVSDLAKQTRGKRVLPREILAETDWVGWIIANNIRQFAYALPVSQSKIMTVRREAKGGTAEYWVAYSSVDEKLVKVYVGRVSDLTVERVETAAQIIIDKWNNQNIVVDESQSPDSPDAISTSKKAIPSCQKSGNARSLTAQAVAHLRRYNDVLAFCTEAFQRRWGRAWQWADGRIYRDSRDKHYYLLSADGGTKHVLGTQRHFVVTVLLYWVNSGSDKGYEVT